MRASRDSALWHADGRPQRRTLRRRSVPSTAPNAAPNPVLERPAAWAAARVSGERDAANAQAASSQRPRDMSAAAAIAALTRRSPSRTAAPPPDAPIIRVARNRAATTLWRIAASIAA